MELNPGQIRCIEGTQQRRCVVKPFDKAIRSVGSTRDDRLGDTPFVRGEHDPLQFESSGDRETGRLKISAHSSAEISLISGVRTLITIPAITRGPCPAR